MAKENHHKLTKQVLSISLIVFLGLILAIALYEFLAAFVGALIFFVLLKPFYMRLTKQNQKRKRLSAVFVIFVSFLVIIIPLTIVASFAIQEIIQFTQNRDLIVSQFEGFIITLEEQFPEFDFRTHIRNIVQTTLNFIQTLVGPLLQNITKFILNLTLLYAFLYFLLTELDTWKKNVHNFLPFDKKNTTEILEEFAAVTNSTIIGSGIIAIIQAIILGISFWIVGFKGIIIWTVIAAILSFLPVIGTPVLWIPATLVLFFGGQPIIAVIFLLFHLIVTSNIDTFLRPIINNKYAKIHPLTSFIGVFFGLYLFGIIGLILGPLLISYFFLSIKLYKKEYS